MFWIAIARRSAHLAAVIQNSWWITDCRILLPRQTSLAEYLSFAFSSSSAFFFFKKTWHLPTVQKIRTEKPRRRYLFILINFTREQAEARNVPVKMAKSQRTTFQVRSCNSFKQLLNTGRVERTHLFPWRLWGMANWIAGRRLTHLSFGELQNSNPVPYINDVPQNKNPGQISSMRISHFHDRMLARGAL